MVFLNWLDADGNALIRLASMSIQSTRGQVNRNRLAFQLYSYRIAMRPGSGGRIGATRLTLRSTRAGPFPGVPQP